MSVTFKCNATGNLVTFKHSVDIESMRIHPEYTEVVPQEEPQEKPVAKKATKKYQSSVDNDTDSI